MKIKIREFRKAAGLTQQQLADATGLSRPYISQMEKGARALSHRNQIKLAQALDVAPDLLVDFSAPDRDAVEEIIEAFERGTADEQRIWLDMARAAIARQKQMK